MISGELVLFRVLIVPWRDAIVLARLWRRETQAQNPPQTAFLTAVLNRCPGPTSGLVVQDFRAQSATRTVAPKRRRKRIQVESLYREVEPRRHALALLRLIQAECPQIVGKHVPHLHLERTYRELCELERWKPRHWTSLSRHLGDLTHKRVIKRDGRRFSAYRIPRP